MGAGSAVDWGVPVGEGEGVPVGVGVGDQVAVGSGEMGDVNRSVGVGEAVAVGSGEMGDVKASVAVAGGEIGESKTLGSASSCAGRRDMSMEVGSQAANKRAPTSANKPLVERRRFMPVAPFPLPYRPGGLYSRPSLIHQHYTTFWGK